MIIIMRFDENVLGIKYIYIHVSISRVMGEVYNGSHYIFCLFIKNGKSTSTKIKFYIV